MATRQVSVDEVFQLAVEKQKVFLRTAAIFLQCRQAEMDDNWCDPFGALLGEVDTTVELSLIIKEWRNCIQR